MIIRAAKKIRQLISSKRDHSKEVQLLPLAFGICKELHDVYGEDVKILSSLLYKANKKFENDIEVLKYLMDKHSLPHNVNHCLASKEASAGMDLVSSYPSIVNMDLTSYCNVECRFCKYTRDLQLPHSSVSMDQIKAIKWFKYVRFLNYSAGTGETLLNPAFVDICKYVRMAYPHLHINFLSNGKALTENLLRQIKGTINQIHISMNASNEEDYNRIVRRGNWAAFSANMKALAQFASESPDTRISASFVMMRWNIERALDYLDYAYKHGAQHVDFFHYYTPHIADYNRYDENVLAEKFPPDQSLYYEKQKADEVFIKVQKRVDELGISAQIPVLFSGHNQYINYGIRANNPPSSDCIQPWMQLFLLWGIKSKREEATMCCGLASDIGAYFNRDEIASTEGLASFWNSPVFRAYRRSVNGKNINPICSACRKTDRFDPGYRLIDQTLFFRHQGLQIPQHFLHDNQ